MRFFTHSQICYQMFVLFSFLLVKAYKPTVSSGSFVGGCKLTDKYAVFW